MKASRILMFTVAAAAVAATVWFLVRGGFKKAGEGDAIPDGASARSGKIADVRCDKLANARKRITEAVDTLTNRNVKIRRSIGVSHPADIESTWVDEDGNPWPEGQRSLMRKVVNASDEEDFDALASLSKDVSKCKNAELREHYVEELGWFGEKAFELLADFISDPSEEVAEEAKTQITDAFRDIEKDEEKAALCVLMSRAVSDSEVLESFTDELSTMDEALALQTIVDMMESGTSNAKAAAEAAYESITDEKWSGIDAAESWLDANYIDSDTMER